MASLNLVHIGSDDDLSLVRFCAIHMRAISRRVPKLHHVVTIQCDEFEHWTFELLLYFPGANNPDSNVHGANMEPIWGRQDPGGPHVGPMKFDIRVS